MAETGALFVKMAGTVAILIVIAGFIGGSDLLKRLEEGTKSLLYDFISGILGGIIGIYGNIAGVDINGAVVSIRDLGPMLAGFAGGPIGGLTAGIIAACHRLTLGGVTMYACAVSTCLIGLICGLLSIKFKDRLIRPQWAFITAVLMESMHLGIVLLIVRPFETAVDIVKQVAIPFIVINSIGFTVLIFIIVYIEKARKSAAEQNRLQSELQAAAAIQRSLLPPINDRFPARPQIRVAASMEAAKEIGGDFYDIFFTDTNHIAFVIGDVSGKGIPAALFMVNAKQTLQNCVRDIPDLSEAVTAANDSLCENNEAEMFVTAWVGVMDLRDGSMQYVNAGHNPPLVSTKENTDYIRGKHGLVLACMEGYRYPQQALELARGDKLFLYTDGVTEAENESHTLYGEEKLQSCLAKASGGEPDSIIEKIGMDIGVHTDGVEQFDDITMMCVEYRGEQ